MSVHCNPRWNILPDEFRYNPSNSSDLHIKVESRGYDDTNGYDNQEININGVNVLSAGSPRSYRMTRIVNNGTDWSLENSFGFDVYSDEGSQALTFLQTFQNNDLLILNTSDEPNNNRDVFRSELVNNFYADLQYSSIWENRCSYIFIAIKNKGVVYESIKPRYYEQIHCVSAFIY